jgi:putative transposase
MWFAFRKATNSSLVPKLHLGTHLSAKLRFPHSSPMRSRNRFHSPHGTYFVTCTVVAWLPVFTTAARCEILTDALQYCRAHKGLKIYAWVILDNHFHAVLAAPDLSRVLADFKRHTAQRLLDQLETEGCEWLLNQLEYFRAKHKSTSQHQVWQEGSFPKEIDTDVMIAQKIEYIHNNPVKRGLVAAQLHWRYSSAHEQLGGVDPVFHCDQE